MKVVILAGGFGTRLGNVTEAIPKPMVRIGNRPILWHIMKIYSYYGFNDFVICLGYKSEVIKEYFHNYRAYTDDFSVDIGTGDITYFGNSDESSWKVTLIDTGLNALKGSRLKQVEPHLDQENLLTYGDGVADIDIQKLIEDHRANKPVVTLSAVHPSARFGEINEDNGRLLAFNEKPQISAGLINGGFMVFDKTLLSYLSTDESCDLEYGTFDTLVEEQKIRVYRHEGRWECVDHQRDLDHLNQLWKSNDAFWKVW